MDKNPFKKDTEAKNQEQETQNLEEIKEEVQEDEADEAEASDIEEKYNALNNNYIRLAADFDNFRKRTAQEKEALATYAMGEVLKNLTTVLDTFDRARDSLKDIEDTKTVKESYEVAYKQFLDTLAKLGMTEIEALGQTFDPNLHEAVTQIPTDEFDPDTVAVVMQKGYKLEDKILRPALVGVAKPKE